VCCNLCQPTYIPLGQFFDLSMGFWLPRFLAGSSGLVSVLLNLGLGLGQGLRLGLGLVLGSGLGFPLDQVDLATT